MKDKLRKKLDRLPEIERDYEVGFARPPIEHQFKPGESGNRAGRPKGSKNKQQSSSLNRLRDTIQEEAYRTISVREGDKNLSLPTARAVIRQVAVFAAKGKFRYQKLFLELVGAAESSSREDALDLFAAVTGYKVQWQRELERRAHARQTGPMPPIDPRDIDIDPFDGIITIHSPDADRMRDGARLLRERLDTMRAEISDMRKAASEIVDDEERTALEALAREEEAVMLSLKRKLDDAGLD